MRISTRPQQTGTSFPAGVLANMALALVLALGCGDDDGPEDPDAAVPMSLPGLLGEVEVIQDDRGMWHIYAAHLEDAYRVQGYLMARDRLTQLDLMRRQTRGELSELFGELTLDDDRQARFQGHARLAEQIWPILSAEEQAYLSAFAEGVTTHIEEVREDPDLQPFTTVLGGVENLRDWQPTDTLAIARFMTASLSLDTHYGLNRTRRLDDYAAAAQDGGPFDDDLRRDAFHDLHPIAPAEFVPFIDGFPDPLDALGSGLRTLEPPQAPSAGTPRPRPPRHLLDAALAFADRQEAVFERWFGDADTRGSNSWVVSGDHTASGYPIMANDPHLALTSPPLFWMVHIDTTRLGDGDVNVQGLALAGTPAVLLGYNEDVAWGMTTHGYDVTDNFLVDLNEDCDAVVGNDGEIPLETVTEVIDVRGTPEEHTLLRTPQHGFVIPGTLDCEEGQAITVRWQGMEPSNELGAILGVNRATNIEEVAQAMTGFEVGGQTLVVAARDGRIYYTSQIQLPVRTNADDYDPTTQEGVSPCFVLPGDGSVAWEGTVDDAVLPQALDPQKGFVATANSDPVGVTFDGNPHSGVDATTEDDNHFIGCDFAHGYRTARITERLEALIEDGDITAQDMSDLQGDAQSPFGRRFSPMLLEELARAEAQWNDPSDHPDLADVLGEVDQETMDAILEMRDRLAAWEAHDYDTPAGVPDSGSPEPVEASIATSIFNVVFNHLLRLTFEDEFDALGHGMNGDIVRTMQWAVDGDERGLITAWDQELRDGQGDMVWWDDISTDDVRESRGDRVVRAFVQGLQSLEELFGTEDMDQWRWGHVHTLRLDSLVPTAEGILSIPPEGDPEFPNGFPRQGDRNVVDASNYSLFRTDDFTYGSGPQQRLVVVMTPDGPQAYNAIPGGNSMDPDGPHQADEMAHWRFNEAPPMYFSYGDVEAHAGTRWTFTP